MRQKIPQLDAVRGIAILVVLAHNLHGFSSLPFSYLTNYGWMGVDLFFALSGFLITGILLDSKSSADYSIFRDGAFLAQGVQPRAQSGGLHSSRVWG